MARKSTSHNGLFIFVGVAALASYLLVAAKAKKQERDTKHRSTGRALSDVEQYVAKSIRVNMPPARRMGIAVEHVQLRSGGVGGNPEETGLPEKEGSVALSMPIKGNTNVHGSAFAGSLYSLCVLSAWYTLICHLRDTLGDETLNRSTVVVQSAEIAYKRPLWNVQDNQQIVATSFLSSGEEEWKGFVQKLKDLGKTTCNISGEIKIKGEEGGDGQRVVAVQFKALLCALLPPASS